MPATIAVPLGVVLMLMVAGQLVVLSRTQQPASRRRIRRVNGGLMLVTIPVLTTGFSLVDPDRAPAVWSLVWLGAMFLLAFVVLFALLDALNTVRLARRRRAALRAAASALREEVLRRRGDRGGRAGDG